MSTRSCIKFSIVIFLQLLAAGGLDAAIAQINPNLQTQTQQIAPPMGVQTPVFQSEHTRPHARRHAVKAHRHAMQGKRAKAPRESQ